MEINQIYKLSQNSDNFTNELIKLKSKHQASNKTIESSDNSNSESPFIHNPFNKSWKTIDANLKLIDVDIDLDKTIRDKKLQKSKKYFKYRTFLHFINNLNTFIIEQSKHHLIEESYSVLF